MGSSGPPAQINWAENNGMAEIYANHPTPNGPLPTSGHHHPPPPPTGPWTTTHMYSQYQAELLGSLQAVHGEIWAHQQQQRR